MAQPYPSGHVEFWQKTSSMMLTMSHVENVVAVVVVVPEVPVLVVTVVVVTLVVDTVVLVAVPVVLEVDEAVLVLDSEEVMSKEQKPQEVSQVCGFTHVGQKSVRHAPFDAMVGHAS